MKSQLRRYWWPLLAFLVVVAALWHGVFVLTGILWWEAPRGPERPAPPPVAEYPTPVTDWVDLEAYQRANPTWRVL